MKEVSLFEYAFYLYIEAGLSNDEAFDCALKLIDNCNYER